MAATLAGDVAAAIGRNFGRSRGVNESEAFESLRPGEDMVGLEQAFQAAQLDEYRPGDSKKK